MLLAVYCSNFILSSSVFTMSLLSVRLLPPLTSNTIRIFFSWFSEFSESELSSVSITAAGLSVMSAGEAVAVEGEVGGSSLPVWGMGCSVMGELEEVEVKILEVNPSLLSPFSAFTPCWRTILIFSRFFVPLLPLVFPFSPVVFSSANKKKKSILTTLNRF